MNEEKMRAVQVMRQMLKRVSKQASEAECRQVPCSPIQRTLVDTMQQVDGALTAYCKSKG